MSKKKKAPEAEANPEDVGLIDMKGIGEKAFLSYNTVRVYKQEGRLPTPYLVINGRPLWKIETIEEWIQDRYLKIIENKEKREEKK